MLSLNPGPFLSSSFHQTQVLCNLHLPLHVHVLYRKLISYISLEGRAQSPEINHIDLVPLLEISMGKGLSQASREGFLILKGIHTNKSLLFLTWCFPVPSYCIDVYPITAISIFLDSPRKELTHTDHNTKKMHRSQVFEEVI